MKIKCDENKKKCFIISLVILEIGKAISFSKTITFFSFSEKRKKLAKPLLKL